MIGIKYICTTSWLVRFDQTYSQFHAPGLIVMRSAILYLVSLFPPLSLSLLPYRDTKLAAVGEVGEFDSLSRFGRTQVNYVVGYVWLNQRPSSLLLVSLEADMTE